MSDALFNGSPMPANRKVSDDENRSQAATIRRIHSFRDELAELQLWLAQTEAEGTTTEARRERVYFNLAKGFLQLLKPYLMSGDDIPAAEQYWTEQPLGVVSVDPPAAIQRPERAELKGALGTRRTRAVARADPRTAVEPRQYRVVGLQDFAAAKAEWAESWTVHYGPGVSPTDISERIDDDDVTVSAGARAGTITVEKQTRVPRHITDEAVTQMERFTRDIGLDVDMNDGVPEFGFEEVYDDGED